jgi:hypothetical protein
MAHDILACELGRVAGVMALVMARRWQRQSPSIMTVVNAIPNLLYRGLLNAGG